MRFAYNKLIDRFTHWRNLYGANQPYVCISRTELKCAINELSEHLHEAGANGIEINHLKEKIGKLKGEIAAYKNKHDRMAARYYERYGREQTRGMTYGC